MQEEYNNRGVLSDGLNVLFSLPKRHDYELFDPLNRSRSFKNISIVHAIREVSIPGDFAEFGVYKGAGADCIIKHLSEERNLYLFDSFEGLPEDWTGVWKKGHFALPYHRIPSWIDPRVVVVKGWFSETLPGFFPQGVQLSFLHLDADLYRSTLDVLVNVNENIVAGSILLFDEYVVKSVGKYNDDEHRALCDWVKICSRKVEYLWRTRHIQVAVRVVE